MVSRKIECAGCNKKCSGNVLKHQNLFYHKQCSNFLKEKQQNQSNKSENFTDQKILNSNNQTQHRARGFIEPSQNKQEYPNSYVIDVEGENKFSSYDKKANNNNIRIHQDRDPKYRDEMSQVAIQTAPSSRNDMRSAHKNNQKSLYEYRYSKCGECKEIIADTEALKALDKHWHVWCFKCTSCKSLLHGEYVAKDGKPYCEKDYQKLFGVTCVYCKRYITGKVLQAGENHFFHPSCARCSKCGDPFVPGEEMYLQGEITWHPRCGPGPDAGLDEIIGGSSLRGSQLHGYRPSSPSLSNRSRSVSPYSYASRQYNRASPYADSEAVGDLSRVYTISYLNSDPAQGYLRKPVEPKIPKSPQFSRPMSQSISRDRSRSSTRSLYHRDRSEPRSGMCSILSSMRSSSTARARSPNMYNEEAIQLSHYPAAKKPNPDEVAKIERDDFPAPPYNYNRQTRSNIDSTDCNIKRSSKHTSASPSASTRLSRSKSREVPTTSLDDESSDDDLKRAKDEKELSKIASGIGKLFINTLREREKIKAWKKSNLDPRNASRTPSATRELPSRLRYENPRNASPSRDLDRSRTWDDDDDYSMTRSMKARSTSSLYMPRTYQTQVDYSRPPSVYSTAAHSNISSKNPPKIYPYHLLITSNYRLPADVDRCHLERHLSNDEFIAIFHCDRSDFYRLPEWRRNELKRRALLF